MSKTYCICQNCGDQKFYMIEPEKCPLHCSNCSTAKQRTENEAEQKKITIRLNALRDKKEWVYVS